LRRNPIIPVTVPLPGRRLRTMAPFLLLAALLLPQGLQGDVSATATVNPTSGASGTTVDVQISLDITPGWHVYHPDQDETLGIPVSAVLIGDSFQANGDFKALSPGRPHVEVISGQTLVYKWMEGKPQFVLPATVSGGPGKIAGKVRVKWQLCNDKVCLPPKTVTIPISFEITADGAVAVPGADEKHAATAAAQDGEWVQGPKTEYKDKRLTWLAWVEHGEIDRLHLEVNVIDNWHIYHINQDPDWGMPLSATIEGVTSGELTSLTPPHPVQETYGTTVANYLFVEGKTEFVMPLELEDGFSGVLPVNLAWTACDDSICDDASQTVINVTVDSTGKSAGGTTKAGNGTRAADPDDGATTEPLPTGSPDNLTLLAADEVLGGDGTRSAINVDAGGVFGEEGLMGLLLAAMLAGLASLLTPCVYPMIPITVSYFTKRAEAGKGTAVGNATAYGVGIMITFVGLGMGAAALLGASGANQIASNPWVNLGIGILFIVLGFSLLGFYEIQPPKFLQSFASKTQGNQNSSGYFPVMLMAVAFSVTAFTCTVGFVGGLLALAATSGEWFSSMLAMSVYAFVFALPFVVLALVPQKLNKLPTAGGWMNAVKVTFGFIELIAALKFLSNADMFPNLGLLPRWLIVILTALCFVAMAAYMFGFYTTKGDYGQKPPRTGKRLAFGTLWAAMAIYVLTGLDGKPFKGDIEGYFPPLEYGAKPGFLMSSSAETEHDDGTGGTIGVDVQDTGHKGLLELTWHEEWEPAIAQAKLRNRLLFIDFTGVTCINCRRMEGNVFPKVKATLARLDRAHLYVDRIQSNADLEISVFRTAAQPYYAVVDPVLFLETIDAAKAYDAAENDADKYQAKLAFERSFKESVLTQVTGYDPNPAKFDEKILGAIELGRLRGYEVDLVDGAPKKAEAGS